MSNMQRLFNDLVKVMEETERPIASHLRPGLSQNAVRQLCDRAGTTIPNDLNELYQIHDGVDALGRPDIEFCLLSIYFFMPLDMALREYNWVKEQALHNDEISSQWFPFLSGEGDFYLVDVQAESQGDPSIICWMMEFDPEIRYTSLVTMVDTLTECYRQGAYSTPGQQNDNKLLIARISAVRNPNVIYWQDRIEQLLGS